MENKYFGKSEHAKKCSLSLNPFKKHIPTSTIPTKDLCEPKNIDALFPKSSYHIKLFNDYHNKLMIEILLNVAKEYVTSNDFKKGNYKIVLIPKIKEQEIHFLHESMIHQDTLGMKLIFGMYNKIPILLSEFRFKKSASLQQKSLELDGASPILKLEPPTEDLHETIKKIDKITEKIGSKITNEQKEALGAVIAFLRAEEEGQKKILSLFCNNEKKHEQFKKILSEIGALSQKQIEVQSKMNNIGKEENKNLDLDSFCGAASKCPIGEKNPEYNPLYRPAITPKEFYEALPQSAQAFASNWAMNYLKTMADKLKGAALLDSGSIIKTIGRFQQQIVLSHSKLEKSKEENFLNKIAGNSEIGIDSRLVIIKSKVYALEKSIAQLMPLIQAIKELDKLTNEIKNDKGKKPLQKDKQERINELKRKIDSEVSKMNLFLKVFQIIEHRKNILFHLSKIEEAVEKLNHDEPDKLQMKKILAHIAFNLCRIRAEEYLQWKDFWTNKEIENLLKSSKFRENSNLKGLYNLSKNFLNASEEESKIVSKIEMEIKNMSARTEYKKLLSTIDYNIISKIRELREAGFVAHADILMEDLELSKTHVNYKQGDALSPKPLNHISTLRLMTWLVNKYPENNEYKTQLEQHISKTAAFFDLCMNKPETQKIIEVILSHTSHVQSKAFDMVAGDWSDPEKIIKSNKSTESIKIEYDVLKDEKGNFLMLYLKNKEIRIDLPETMPYDWADEPNPEILKLEKNPLEEIYGSKYPTEKLIPDYQKINPKELFKRFYDLAFSSQQKISEIKADLNTFNMENARALSTLATKNRYSGCVANFGGFYVENPPLLFNNDIGYNTFLEKIQKIYPNFERDKEDIDYFIKQQIAFKFMSKFTIHQAQIAYIYVSSILANKFSNENN